MQQKRALETEEQSQLRKLADRAYKSMKRGIESHYETLSRQIKEIIENVLVPKREHHKLI